MIDDCWILTAFLLVQLNACVVLGWIANDVIRWSREHREAQRRAAEEQDKRGEL